MSRTLVRALSRSLAVSLSTLVILLSPGLACTEALAGENFSSRGSGVPALRLAMPAASTTASPLGAAPDSASISLPGANLPFVDAAAVPASAVGARSIVPSEAPPAGSAASPASAPTAPEAVSAVQAETSATELKAITGEVSSTLESAGDLSAAPLESAPSVSGKLQEILSRQRGASAASLAASAAAPVPMGSLTSSRPGGLFMAKPAGQEIGEAAAAYHGGPRRPVPPGGGGSNGSNGGPTGNKAPLWAKLLSAAITIVPAVLLAAPLFSAGSTLGAILVLSASVAAAGLSFMSASTPRWTRSLPGVSLGALGAWTVLKSALTLSAPGLAMGGLALLGGWGLVRFALDQDKWASMTPKKMMGTFFGAFAAAVGAGLVLLHPAGWLAGAATYAAFVGPLFLLTHLPGWVGQAVATVLRGVLFTFQDIHHALSAVRRDTALFDRLKKYTAASWKRSSWSGLWLGLLLWVPAGLSEALQAVLAAAAAVAIGALRAPALLLWGASHGIKPDWAPTKFFAAWARFQFEKAAWKTETFNPVEKKLLPYANSKSKLTNLAGILGLRAAQTAWALYSVARAPLAAVIGFFAAFGATGVPYKAELHSPERLELPYDPLPDHYPRDSEPAVGLNPVLPRVLSTAVGLLPFLAFGGLWKMLPLGTLFAATALAVGLMPTATPQSVSGAGRYARFKMAAPGWLMAATGGWLAASAAVVGLLTGLNTWLYAGLGVLTLVSGLGLRNLTRKLYDDKGSSYRTNDPWYLYGFASAVALTAALGVTLNVFDGPAAKAIAWTGFASSLVLLYHMPKYLLRGGETALAGLWYSVRSVHRVLNYWSRDAAFGSNLQSFFKRYSPWTWPLWAVAGAAKLAEYAVAFAVGLAYALVKSPVLFAWGAAYEVNHDGRLTRLVSGLSRSLLLNGIGSKNEVFDAWARGLKGPLSSANAGTGAPTLRAVAALLGLRLLQLAWLARLIVWSPVIVFKALRDALRNARGPKVADPNGWDPDRPDPDHVVPVGAPR